MNSSLELSPQRLCVGILISKISEFRVSESELSVVEQRVCTRKFCILLLKLFQSPDLTYEGLCAQIGSIGNSEFKADFESAIMQIYCQGVDKLLDVVNAMKLLVSLDNQLQIVRSKIIARTSAAGIYLRRFVLQFEQLSFSEITAFFAEFKEHVEQSKVAGCDTSTFRMSKNEHLMIQQNFNDEHIGKNWTKHQAELFTTTQSALIANNNERKALDPKELHKNIKALLKSNPNIASAHFLSYLNYMRVKEYCGAIESLHHCFDQGPQSGDKYNNADERSKCYRYAVLNLAILYYKFGYREQSMMALKEAIKIAQETNDTVCLQHAHSWLYCLNTANCQKLMQHSIVKSLDLNISYVMSLGIQAYVQYAALSTGNPKQVFVSLTRSDIINCQNNEGHQTLLSTSYAQKAAIWLFYGKTAMASLWSQLLLFGSNSGTLEASSHSGQNYAMALLNLAGIFHADGEYNMRNTVMALAKEQDPQSSSWMLCKNLFAFQRQLFNCKFTEAEQSASRVSVIDKYEGSLCKAMLYIHTGDFEEAHKEVNQILNRCKETNAQEVRMDVQVRAMIVLADVQIATCLPCASPAGLLGLLNSSLAYANDYNMQYLAAMAQMRIAHVQLLSGMSLQAERILERCLVQILAHGGAYDRARVLFLDALCKVANSFEFEEERRKILLETVVEDLERVASLFKKVEAQYRVKDVLILKAKLYNELGMKQQRNNAALECLNLNEEYPNTIGPVTFKMV